MSNMVGINTRVIYLKTPNIKKTGVVVNYSDTYCFFKEDVTDVEYMALWKYIFWEDNTFYVNETVKSKTSGLQGLVISKTDTNCVFEEDNTRNEIYELVSNVMKIATPPSTFRELT